MTYDQAVQRLRIHSGSTEAPEGFLYMLRPYKGLDHEVFQDLAECVVAILPHLREASTVDRELANCLWGISFFARHWALREDGMLQRNDLITAPDQATLTKWLDALDWAIAMTLDGQPEDAALELLHDVKDRTPPGR